MLKNKFRKKNKKIKHLKYEIKDSWIWFNRTSLQCRNIWLIYRLNAIESFEGNPLQLELKIQFIIDF